MGRPRDTKVCGITENRIVEGQASKWVGSIALASSEIEVVAWNSKIFTSEAAGLYLRDGFSLDTADFPHSVL
jgi:hypothetical protein